MNGYDNVALSRGNPLSDAMQTTQQPAPVHAAQDAMDESIKRLYNLADTLEARLNPILSPHLNAGGDLPTRPPVTPSVAGRIVGSANAVDDVTARLNSLLSRLEI